MITTDRIVIAVGALAAFLLQVLIAPHIAILSAMPNFMVAFSLAIAIARKEGVSPILPFAMGLLFDLLSGGPVGAMAFSLTAASALGSWIYRRTGNDTLFMAIAVLAASVFVLELLYGLLILLFGFAAGFFEAFVYRMLPCFIYDFIVTLIAYLVVVRFLNRDVPLQSEIKQL